MFVQYLAYLEGKCHEIFCIRFSWIIFPQAPENKIKVIPIFFEKIAEIFASQKASPISMSPNLPPVSTIPVASVNYTLHNYNLQLVSIYPRLQR